MAKGKKHLSMARRHTQHRQVIGQRRRYSDGLLRDLLRHEQARGRGQGGAPDVEQMRASILRKIEAIERHDARDAAARHAREAERAARAWAEMGKPRAEEPD